MISGARKLAGNSGMTALVSATTFSTEVRSHSIPLPSSRVMITPVLFKVESVSLTVRILVMWAWLVALAMVVRSVIITRELGKGMEWLRTSVLNVVADTNAVIPELPANFRAPEIVTLLKALARYQDQVTRERLAPDRAPGGGAGRRWPAAWWWSPSRARSACSTARRRELLGAERARVGTSLFAALSRDSVRRRWPQARKAGGPVEAVFERLDGVDLQGRVAALPDDEGAIIIFPPVELDRHRPGVEFDLELHDVPPAVGPSAWTCPWRTCRGLILDTETTGLDVDRTASSRWARSAPTARGSSAAA